MKLSDAILLEKHKDVLRDKTQVIFGEGVTGGSKSFIFGIKFLLEILGADEHKKQFVIAGQSLPTLEKMYIQNPSSFYHLFRAICTYKSHGEGGARIEVQTPTGNKTIYLIGYDNSVRWKQILGLTIYGFNVEEINIADDEFISEMFVRVFRNSAFLYCTSNGGDPDTLAYTDYLNKGRPLDKYLHQVPHETMEELNRSEESPNFRYYFFNFDDNPTMSESEKQALIDNTPKNSYMWQTKILGIRGIREGIIYANYMQREKNIIDFHNGDYHIDLMTIGIDVGGTDHTVFTLNGFTSGYKHHIVIDYFKLNNANHDEIWNAFVKWFAPYYTQYSHLIKGAFIDSASKIMRLTMDSRMKKQFFLRCYGAKKYTIKERVDWGITQLDQGRLLFTKKTEDIYVAFAKAFYNTTSKTDIRAFNNHTHKDMVDSVEYGQSAYTAYMMTNKGG